MVDSAGVKPKKTAAQKLRQRNYKIGRKILETAPVKALFPDALEEFRRSHGSADYNSATPVMRQTLVNTVNEDLVEYMPNMKMPVLLVWGENDDATPLSELWNSSCPTRGSLPSKIADTIRSLSSSSPSTRCSPRSWR